MKYRKWTRTLLAHDQIRTAGITVTWLSGMHRHYWPEAWKMCSNPYVLLHLIGALSSRKTYVDAISAGLANEMPSLFGYGTVRQSALRCISEAYGMPDLVHRRDHWRYQIQPLVVGPIQSRQQPSAAMFEALRDDLFDGMKNALVIPSVLEGVATFNDLAKACTAIRAKTERPALPGHVVMASA